MEFAFLLLFVHLPCSNQNWDDPADAAHQIAPQSTVAESVDQPTAFGQAPMNGTGDDGGAYGESGSVLTVVALFDFDGSEEDELTFEVGEQITEVEKIDVGWWKGVCRNRVGLFPANYVEEQ